ncbi:MAG TPA: hypothetical protein VK804_29360 [Bradyrhizobium sp.]|uniref:hypothetical protein n=1 Tax=Bradyrhizobium sp. TaxID=376 RepID=UPI002CAFAC79|nr:hypothetical protein [Bradyrhizobium sp.]HTB04598.1 hypothetical protein [Bradyrhizobium sp.]
MSAETLTIVGEFAGAGGVILLIVIFLFRDILISKLAQKLSRAQANRAISVMIFGVLGLAAAGSLTAFLAHSAGGCSSKEGNITVTQGNSNSSVLSTGCGNAVVER